MRVVGIRQPVKLSRFAATGKVAKTVAIAFSTADPPVLW
jgi:hypothetical protein